MPPYTEEELDDLTLSLGELREDMVDFPREGFIHEGAISVGGIFVDQYIQEAVVLALNEGSINGDMTTRDLQSVCYLILGDV